MITWIKMIIAAAIMTIIIIAGTLIYLPYFSRRRLMISTTTSLYDTGLLDEIEKAFETKYPIDLNFIAVGTGIAIQHAQKGDVDLILVHSPSLERTFLEKGYGVCRKVIAYNFFTIVGPEADTVGIKGLKTNDALEKIAEYGRNFTTRIWVSRGDNSGTHLKEKKLWTIASYNYSKLSIESWYTSASAGMGQTLLEADHFSAYTLSDIGTYVKYSKDGRITLKALITEEQELLNVYSAIAVNQTRHINVKFDDAITFIKYLISNECQQLIESSGKDEYRQNLFYGAVRPLEQNPSSEIAQSIQSYAFFNNSECPIEYISGHPELYG